MALVYAGVSLAALAILIQSWAAHRRRSRGHMTPRERMIAQWAAQQVRRIEMGIQPQDLTLAIYLGHDQKPKAEGHFPADVEPAESV